MKIKIIGDGMFGSFLTELLGPYVQISDEAEHIFLAVPIEAYEEVSSQYAGKHLINICSVQNESNSICLRHSENVTGLHPMFGPQSPRINWTAVLTHTCSKTPEITELFQKLGVEICTEMPDGQIIDGELHDRMMAMTHLASLQLAENLNNIVKNASWVPEKFVPPSFRRIRDFVKQCRDFSPGTESSIRSNPFGNEIRKDN